MNIQDAMIAYDEGRYEQVVDELSVCSNATVLNLRGGCLINLERWSEALKSFEEAVSIDPTNARSQANLCAALRENFLIQDSVDAGFRALKLAPNDVSIVLNLSLSCSQAGLHDYCEKLAKHALCIDPENHDAHVTLGYNLLLQHGDFRPGWLEAAWSAQRPGEKEHVPAGIRSWAWNGMNLGEQPLVAVCDQGFGDAFFYSRYLSCIRSLCGELVVVGPKEMEIMGDNVYVSRFQTNFGDLPTDFAHVRFSHLPLFAEAHYPGSGFEGVNNNLSEGKLRIGLCWRGRPLPRGRSIPFEELSEVLRPYTKLVDFVSLVPDTTAQETDALPGMLVQDLPSFRDTAKLLATLDAVYTIDSAMLHFAGTMFPKVPTIALISHYNGWYWGTDNNERSLWYPNVLIGRQTKPGDWSETLLWLVGRHLKWRLP